jgi:preprotein translocase subunit YajC
MIDLLSFLVTDAYAQAGDAVPPSSGFRGLIPLILIFVIFYFIVIRPQQKKIKAHEELVKNLSRGDSVVTSGGIVGKVLRVDEQNNMLDIEIASGVEVKVVRSTVSDIYSRSGKEESVAKKAEAKKPAAKKPAAKKSKSKAKK